ncbi:TLD-domain-containing protein [Hyaloraphidium curvatum]|nr:TLD-domain-containing protein [Hyaloraphidium curvatum]
MAAFEKALAEGPPKFEEEAATASPAPTLTEDQAARKIQRAWRKHETYPELELKERQTDEAIISKEIASELRRHIPRRLRNSPHWTLLYSLTQHGSSMSTLYRNLLNGGPVFLSIKTTKGKVFGAFVSEQVRVADDGKGNARAGKTGGYYGTGESFLWRVLPKTATADGSTTEHPEVHTMKDGSRLWLHEASMDNDYFISTQQDCIILGGGGKSGAVALYIAADLFNGYSDGSSPTYNLGGIALGSDEDLP